MQIEFASARKDGDGHRRSRACMALFALGESHSIRALFREHRQQFQTREKEFYRSRHFSHHPGFWMNSIKNFSLSLTLSFSLESFNQSNHPNPYCEGLDL